jgi:hypothetical protein
MKSEDLHSTHVGPDKTVTKIRTVTAITFECPPEIDRGHDRFDDDTLFQKPEMNKANILSRIPLTSANMQLLVLAVVTLCGPGMFSALNGLGGAGLSNPTAVNNSLVANYGSSAVVGFIAGPIVNRIGYRLSLLIGAFAFGLYPLCLLVYLKTRKDWVLILGGTISGTLCSIEWTALGAMLMTYPSPKSKGKQVSLNIAAFNLGAVTGSLVRTDQFNGVLQFEQILTAFPDGLYAEYKFDGSISQSRNLHRVRRCHVPWSTSLTAHRQNKDGASE